MMLSTYRCCRCGGSVTEGKFVAGNRLCQQCALPTKCQQCGGEIKTVRPGMPAAKTLTAKTLCRECFGIGSYANGARANQHTLDPTDQAY